MANKLGGHPDPDVQKLFRTLKNSVELCETMQGKLPEGTYEVLRAATLGLMESYAQVTGKASPIQAILADWEGRLRPIEIGLEAMGVELEV
jgi:hypothetical protein